MIKRLKIFVSAYACEPDLGSEIGVGWHWILEMSKYFDLWVLTRKSNQHTIEPWIEKHPEYNHIHFLYYDWPHWARFWKKGLRGVRTYYNIWQFCTNHIVKQTMQKNDIKVFHHLTYGNMLWKVSSYGQKQFFIWGPTGGLETIPAEFSKHYNLKSRLVEGLRRTTVNMLGINTGFKNHCRNADLILCKTDITKSLIPKKYSPKAVLFTDVAVEKNISPTIETSIDNKKIEYITVGRLDAWRGFDLVIESFAQAVKQNPGIHLTIVGKGQDEERLRKIVCEKNLEEYIIMTGKVTMQRYHQLIAGSDVVINASLKEGAVTVSFDSMAMGKPLICLDTTGYTRYFSKDYAIIIPIESRRQVLHELQTGILILTDKQKRIAMGTKAGEAGEKFTWQARGKEFFKLLSSRL